VPAHDCATIAEDSFVVDAVNIAMVCVSAFVARFPVHVNVRVVSAGMVAPTAIAIVSYIVPLEAETVEVETLAPVAAHVVPVPTAAKSVLVDLIVTVLPETRAPFEPSVTTNFSVFGKKFVVPASGVAHFADGDDDAEKVTDDPLMLLLARFPAHVKVIIWECATAPVIVIVNVS
tara:strand:- start:1080 stop:1604 length:525 start_codon:yes stop_codon:yes gene_type:complete